MSVMLPVVLAVLMVRGMALAWISQTKAALGR
jgi:hypothetical protein